MTTVLVVEDHAANMKLAMLPRHNAGHTSLCTADSEAGVALARASRPDLILMDLHLPGMDGLTATALPRRTPATAAIPIIVPTAMAMKADRKKKRGLAGCDAFITKPLRCKELYAAIETLLADESPEVPPRKITV